MDKKSSRYGLIVLLTIAVIAILMGFSKIASAKRVPEGFSQKTFSFSKNRSPYFAVLYITGEIQEKGSTYDQKWLLSTIEALKKDEKNEGILLYINSPGGTVYHADEAYLELLKYKESGKKIYAYFAEMAASGGYYIGCAADKIYANRNTLTGSIGVISASAIDATNLLEKIGIKAVTVHTGKNKNMLNFNEEFTEEQLQIMQSLSDEAYEQFTQIVSESRKMDLKTVQALADGRVYSARQAKQNGLIDEICSLEEAKQDIKEGLNLGSDLTNVTFKDFKYDRTENLRSLFLGGFSAIKNPQSVLNRGPVLSYRIY